MAGTNETSYYLKHGNNLNPLVSKKSDLEDQNIPKWDDTEQRLTDSAVSESYDSVADETTVAIDGNADIDGKANITSDTAIGGNVEVDGTSQFNDDVTIGKAAQGADPEVQADLHVVGNIYQSGASVQTHLEQIYTTKDHIFLRYGEVAALANGDHSGLKVIKPDGTYDVHLCVNNDNYAYVGEVDNNDDPIEYTGHYQFWDSGLYYDDDVQFLLETRNPRYGNRLTSRRIKCELTRELNRSLDIAFNLKFASIFSLNANYNQVLIQRKKIVIETNFIF